MSSEKPYVIVGGGLVGSLLAIYLAKRGLPVVIYERRDDMRKDCRTSAGRSINLAMSYRALNALKQVGLDQEFIDRTLPMHNRQMHAVDGGLSYMPYGQQGQAIRSVSRRLLNERLMSLAEEKYNVKIHFQHRLVDYDLNTNVVTFQDDSVPNGERREVRFEAKVVFGTDGAFSTVRSTLANTIRTRFNTSQEYLDHAYKELCVPAVTNPETGEEEFALCPDNLHIWPRGDFMMIALPNQDKSFTVTLFMPWKIFDSLNTDEKVTEFFQTYFPSAIPLMPTLLEDYRRNPAGALVTVKCEPFHFEDKAVLLGDSAHAVVPFYGQGMNCGFEDVFVFDQIWEQYNGDLSKVLPAFSVSRKPNTDAIAQLSLNNYIEMRSKVASTTFLVRSYVEKWINRMFPGKFIPLYQMVAFSQIPYGEVIKRNEKQAKIIDKAVLGLGFTATVATSAIVLRFAQRVSLSDFGRSLISDVAQRVAGIAQKVADQTK
eukprot:TRINITY_DN2164_c0_g1_i1.p1 TRINITY_DN2164_c0_g1~~TRINITY_DN2164_c0_g1_i1.p1  ORF type:complete len:486 (-),score=108.05 TRINITY_DN2164_c0_g1_i1:129-1586(-)